MILDVSRPLAPGSLPWPGDEPYTCGFSATRAAGSSVNVGWTRSSVHNGTHVDAPAHFLDDGAAVDLLPLDAFLGPCRVATVPSDGPIGVEDIPRLRPGERLLLRTSPASAPGAFPRRFGWPSLDLAHALAEAGAPVLGTDAPSVDAFDSKDLASHRALAEGGVQILENLDLAAAPDGAYELVAFPIRLAGMDGAPVRAVLLR